MTMVPWSRLSAEQVETLVSVLLSREHPHAHRVRPAQGDGGIDVLIPAGPPVADIHQIKSFTSALTRSQRRQVEHSLRTIAQNRAVQVRDWSLTLPLNPSPPDLAWLADLQEQVTFTVRWFGLDRLEALAAAHQDVVDYYTGDGRVRLERSIDQLRALAGLTTTTATGHLLVPDDTQKPLADLYRLLNRDDPHFRYEFEVGQHPPTLRAVVTRPDLVASQTVGDGGVFVTHHVYSRYDLATEDRPVPLTFSVRVDDMDDDVRAAWDRALHYGTPVTVPAPLVVDMRFDLPGGVASTASQATLRIGPARRDDAKPYRLRLRVVEPDGAVLHEVVLNMDAPTRGMTGRGWRGYGHEVSGAFTIELTGDIDDDGTAGDVRFALTVGTLSGAPPAALRRAVRLLGAMHHPNRFDFAPEFGPPVGDPFDVPLAEAPITDDLVELIDALADLQDQVCADLVVPDLDNLTDSDLRSIDRAGRLVRGETVTDTWTDYEFKFTSNRHDLVDSPVQLALSGSSSVTIGDTVVPLDPLTLVLLAANIDIVGDGDDAILKATPALGNNTMTMRLAAIHDVAPVAIPVHDVSTATGVPPDLPSESSVEGT